MGPLWAAGPVLAALVLACAPPRRELPATSADAGERLVVDTRAPAAFAAAHAPGALNLQWDWDQLDQRVAAYVPDRDTPLALQASDADEAVRAAELLERRGYTDVERAPPVPQAAASLPTMTARALADALAAGVELVVLDVREPWEHALGTIEGARRLDPDGAARALASFEADVEYAVICEAGYRSGQLASWMQRHGLRATNVLDGMAGWRALGNER